MYNGIMATVFLGVYLAELRKTYATYEGRTHDLQIMRLTRCQLRQGGTTYV